MLTKEQFDSLAETDLIETEPLAPGLSGEVIKLRVSKILDNHTRIEFVATWYGVTLGRWVCTETGGKLGWSF